MRILLTGGASFTAGYLVPELVAAPGIDSVAATDVVDKRDSAVAFHRADVTDPASLRRVLKETRPDVVFHLAAVTGRDAQLCHRVNFEGTQHLIDAAADRENPPGILFVSSAAVYGLTRREESPVKESTPLRPVSAYGVSKAAAELAVLSAHRGGRIAAVVVRPFNLLGPGLPPGFAPSDFAARAAALRDVADPEIGVGNLTPRRDFVDVRDAVRAYRMLAGTPGAWGQPYNVASGRPVAIRELLDRVLEAAGVVARVVEDPAKVRPVEVEEQAGDPRALHDATTWTAGVPFEQSVKDLVQAAMA